MINLHKFSTLQDLAGSKYRHWQSVPRCTSVLNRRPTSIKYVKVQCYHVHCFAIQKWLNYCWSDEKKTTRAGVCKTLCPQLPDSNTVWLQHCLAMTVTTVQIYDFNVILSKGNNSKIGDDWDKKKIRITYFFMRNQNMKFQNISIHGSKLMLYRYTIKQRH